MSKKLTESEQEQLSRELGEALSLIPGKDGRGLIVDM